MRFFMLMAIFFFVVFSVNVNAALIDRGTDSLGNRLFYDDVLNVTWYDFSHGVATWSNAVDWAAGLSIVYEGNVYSDWRLPHALPVNGTDYNYNYREDGSSDIGYNITSPNAEMAHLFYVTLAKSRGYDWNYQETLVNEFFNNMHGWYYWYGSVYGGPPANGDADWDIEITPDPNDPYQLTHPYLYLDDGVTRIYDIPRGFFFHFGTGLQDSWGGTTNGSMTNYAIAVRDGNVSPIPEPTTMLLLGAGLLGLAGLGRKKFFKRG